MYGYNADVSSKKHGTGPSSNYIHQHAQTLVTFLTTYRKSKKTTRNPIIWVAHSLGGILVKRALEHSDSVRVADHEDYRSIYVSTYGIIFLGTPHDGSELASWGAALQGMAGHVPRKFFDSEPVLIETLRKDNETLDNININFLNIYQRFKIHMVHENQKTDLKGTKSLIVDAKSAAPRLPGVTSYGVEADVSNHWIIRGLNTSDDKLARPLVIFPQRPPKPVILLTLRFCSIRPCVNSLDSMRLDIGQSPWPSRNGSKQRLMSSAFAGTSRTTVAVSEHN